MRNILIIALALAISSTALAREPNPGSPIVTIHNNSFSTITNIKTISADGTVSESASKLVGGGNEVALRMASNTPGRAGCLFRIDLTFADRAPITVDGFNACRGNRLNVRDAVNAANRQGG